MNEFDESNASDPQRSEAAGEPKARSKAIHKAKLVVRLATLADVPEIAALSRRVYPAHDAHSMSMIRAQINNFARGQFVAEYEGKIVGHCATFIISGAFALSDHSWNEITGNGYASRHDPKGDFLYGMEVSVDPGYRRLRIGQHAPYLLL